MLQKELVKSWLAAVLLPRNNMQPSILTPQIKALPIPVRAGVGLKPDHYQTILETKPDIGWFEIHPENYMANGGATHHYL